MTRCQVQKWDGESPQVIWDRCALCSSRTECRWLPDSGGGGHSVRIWWYLTPARIGWRPLPRPAFTLSPLLRFRLTTHTSHERGQAQRAQTNMYVFFFLSACALTQKWMAFGWWMPRRVGRLGPYIRSDILILHSLKPFATFLYLLFSLSSHVGRHWVYLSNFSYRYVQGRWSCMWIITQYMRYGWLLTVIEMYNLLL